MPTWTSRRWKTPLTRWIISGGAVPILLSLAAPEAQGQLRFGPQVSAGSDSGAGIGARATFPLRVGIGPLDGAIDASYASPSGVKSWIQTNVNARLQVPLAADFGTVIGAGLNASFISAEVGPGPTTETDTQFGLNLLGGISYPREGILGGRVVPFTELRGVVGGAEEVVLTIGLTFGGAPESERD